MTTKAYKERVAASKSSIETEIRAVTRKLSHRPVSEIVQYLRDSRHIAADPAFVESLLDIKA